ncbi:MAG: hypothetical protein U9R75_01105, partial [Candidatus Thermoplasmatota archaeon]|nr:hypothetical protein [Candidatus Thermoplasmatota archaeon]
GIGIDLFQVEKIDTDPLSDYNGNKWDKINPGAEGLYTMSINNKGDLNDTYEMTLSYPPRDAGWDWYFIETESLTANVSLTAPPLADQFGGITGQALTVKVECPIEAIANTRIPILLKGTSVLSKTSNMEEITKKDELIMVVGSEMDFEMGATQTEMLMLPEDNGTMDFEIILTNTGNTGMYILISAQGIPSGLDVKFSKDPIKLNYSSTVLFPVRVCFPEYLLYDQGDVISLKFFGITEGPRKNISVNITIGRWADLDVEYIGPDPIIIKPGESGNGTVRITNLGNAPEWINASLEGERDSLSLSLSTVEQTSIIQARDHLDIEVTAHAHQDAGSSIGTIYLNITSEISSPVSIPIDVEVVHLHNVSMRLVDGSVKLTDTISPGDARKYVIVIENHGNGPENLDLDIGSQFTGAGNEKVDIAS